MVDNTTGRSRRRGWLSSLRPTRSNLQSQVPSPPSSDNHEGDSVPQIASPPQTPHRQMIMAQMNDDMAISLPAAIAAFSTLTLTVTPQRRSEITMDTPPSGPQTLTLTLTPQRRSEITMDTPPGTLQTPTRSFQTAVPILSSPTPSRHYGGRFRSSASLSLTDNPTEVNNWYPASLCYLSKYTDIHSSFRWTHAADG